VEIVLAQGWHPPGLNLTVSNEDFNVRCNTDERSRA
jgi:hypothetical protein